MKTEFVTKEIAIERYEKTKEIAFAIAKANDTLPAYCSAPECKLHVAYAALTQLKTSEQCLFIDGFPAEILTDFYIDSCKRVIGKLLAENMVSAKVAGDRLEIEYADGMTETYTYIVNLECWKFLENNTSGLKLAQRGIN